MLELPQSRRLFKNRASIYPKPTAILQKWNITSIGRTARGHSKRPIAPATALYFYSNGFSAEPRDPRREDGTVSNWKVVFGLASYGDLDVITPLAQPRVDIAKNAGTFALDNIEVNYTNTVQGLQQTFLVKRKPVVGALQIRMPLILEGVYMDWDEDASGAVFRNAVTHEDVLYYSDLHVFDATGRELPSRMDIVGGNAIILDVDDADAVYPVLVDPWAYGTALTGSAQAGSQLGYSLAFYERRLEDDFHLGYFGSIIIGAPYFDGGQTDEGSVFGYLGSSSGLPTSPNWTKEINVQYANFGNCLAVAQAFDPADFSIPTFQEETTDFSDLVVGAHN